MSVKLGVHILISVEITLSSIRLTAQIKKRIMMINKFNSIHIRGG